MKKSEREIALIASRFGLVYDPKGSGHPKLRDPVTGAVVYTVPRSGSDKRQRAKMTADLRRIRGGR